MKFVLQNRVFRRFALAHFFLECQFWFPVWLIFLQYKGFDLTTIVLADGVFRTSVVVFEVPLGWVSDQIGRKSTYLLICGLSVITYSGIILIEGTAMLFIMWIVWGVLWALYSGMPSSYMYELLVLEGKEEKSVQTLGSLNVVTNAAALFSHLTAGLLLAVQPALPFVVNGILALSALFIVLSLPSATETLEDDAVSRKGALLPFFTIYRETRVVPIATFLLAISLIYFWSPRILMQPLFIELKLSPTIISVVYFFYSLGGILAGLAVDSFSQYYGMRRSIFLGFLLIWIGVTFIALMPDRGALFFFPLLSFGFIISQTLLETTLHRKLNNRFRASVLSAVSFLGGVVIIFTRPGLGILSDTLTTPYAFLSWSGLGIIMLVLYGYFVRKLPINS